MRVVVYLESDALITCPVLLDMQRVVRVQRVMSLPSLQKLFLYLRQQRFPDQVSFGRVANSDKVVLMAMIFQMADWIAALRTFARSKEATALMAALNGAVSTSAAAVAAERSSGTSPTPAIPEQEVSPRRASGSRPALNGRASDSNQLSPIKRGSSSGKQSAKQSSRAAAPMPPDQPMLRSLMLNWLTALQNDRLMDLLSKPAFWRFLLDESTVQTVASGRYSKLLLQAPVKALVRQSVAKTGEKLRRRITGTGPSSVRSSTSSGMEPVKAGRSSTATGLRAKVAQVARNRKARLARVLRLSDQLTTSGRLGAAGGNSSSPSSVSSPAASTPDSGVESQKVSWLKIALSILNTMFDAASAVSRRMPASLNLATGASGGPVAANVVADLSNRTIAVGNTALVSRL